MVKGPDKKERLREALIQNQSGERCCRPGPYSPVLCGKIKSLRDYKGQSTREYEDLFLFDLSIAAQIFCLTAYNLGLGAVIVGNFDPNNAKETLEAPEGYERVTLIPLRYPVEGPAAPKRREISEFIH